MRLAFVLLGGLHPSGRREVIPLFVGLLSALARRHTVHAFVLRHLPEAADYELEGVHVHDLGRPSAPAGLTRLAQGRALRSAVQAHGPFDVIHGIWGDPAGLLATRTGRALDIPSVVTCDSGEFVSLPAIGYGQQQTWRGRQRLRLATARADRVHVCTHYQGALAARLHVAAEVLPLGIAVPGADAVQRPADGPPWRLLQVASLNPVKDQDLLIDAVALLARTHEVELDLAGEDTRAGAVHRRVAARDLAGRVRFHGWVAPAALATLRNRAHLYVQTSRHEGAGVSVLEAAAAGLPIVGTRVGYVADWAPEGAFAVEAATPETLAATLADALDWAGERRRRADHARAFAVAHDVHWSVAALERMYASLTRG